MVVAVSYCGDETGERLFQVGFVESCLTGTQWSGNDETMLASAGSGYHSFVRSFARTLLWRTRELRF